MIHGTSSSQPQRPLTLLHTYYSAEQKKDIAQLMEAIGGNKVEEVKSLFQVDSSLKHWLGGGEENDFQGSFLHEAVACGSADVVKLLCTEYDFTILQQDASLNTPLHLAVKNLIGRGDFQEVSQALAYEQRRYRSPMLDIFDTLILQGIKKGELVEALRCECTTDNGMESTLSMFNGYEPVSLPERIIKLITDSEYNNLLSEVERLFNQSSVPSDMEIEGLLA